MGTVSGLCRILRYIGLLEYVGTVTGYTDFGGILTVGMYSGRTLGVYLGTVTGIWRYT